MVIGWIWLLAKVLLGKTVMIYHVIDKLLNEGVDAKQILYVSLENAVVHRAFFRKNR
ncbi:hypothetical protein [Methylocucumis oryzae]|uniref:hypothetical protein n=1 Tax=Methylocucumis oryzae TaxID=1632867 RepID=UPI00195529E5|nr:hypothetical protein [Methylocucumis oryzae]